MSANTTVDMSAPGTIAVLDAAIATASRRLAVDPAAAEAALLKYLVALARGADGEDVGPNPPLRYTPRMIEADAIASASCGD